MYNTCLERAGGGNLTFGLGSFFPEYLDQRLRFPLEHICLILDVNTTGFSICLLLLLKLLFFLFLSNSS